MKNKSKTIKVKKEYENKKNIKIKQPAKNLFKNEKLSFLIPVYNEEKTIKKIIEKITSIDWPIKIEIVISEGGSKDRTKEKLKEIKKELGKKSIETKIIVSNKRKGKGENIQTAIQNATGTIYIIQDADLEYYPEDIIILLYALKTLNINVVYGSRELGPSKRGYFIFYLGNRFLTFIANLLYGQKMTDPLTCYKMFTKKAIEGIRLKSKGFGFDPELTSKLIKKGYKIYEVPIRYNPRSFEEGKQNSIKVGIETLLIFLKLRFFKEL